MNATITVSGPNICYVVMIAAMEVGKAVYAEVTKSLTVDTAISVAMATMKVDMQEFS